MRIVYCGCFRFPVYDAAAQRVLNNAKLFREQGHTVQFISWGGKYDEKDLCDDGKYRFAGFEYVITHELDAQGSFLHRLRCRMARGRASLALLEGQTEKPDLIILYNAGYFWTKTMFSYCNRYQVKLANDITEWYDWKELHLTDVFPNEWNMRFLQHKIRNKIVISNFLNNYYPTSNNIQLPPLCDETDKKWKAVLEDNRLQPFDGITLIYAGNPVKKDCVHTVINAVNVLINEGQRIRFILLGTTRESYLKRYGKQLLSQKLSENIIFLGRVSQELIPAYYKKADFMVLLREPTRKNMAGFPTKFAESMTAGVPVICNSTSDISRYLIEGKTGFLVGENTYESILNVLRDKVVNLKRLDIEQMKQQTNEMGLSFSCRNKCYMEAIQNFIENLH